jgi:hypothetical protein
LSRVTKTLFIPAWHLLDPNACTRITSFSFR